jgi:fluoride ion exporter CrcB/FEX
MDASFAVMSLAIGAGSALGGMLRYWCLFLTACTLGETFPLGTLFVNVVGSFLIVLIAPVSDHQCYALRFSSASLAPGSATSLARP